MGFWGWLIVILVLGGLIWLIVQGPVSLKLALAMLVTGMFLGVFLWEVLLDTTTPDLWPNRKPPVIVKDSRDIPESDLPITVTIESLPQTLSSTQAVNIGENGEVIAYLYDDPKTPNVDLVIESPTAIELSVNGVALPIDEVNIDKDKYYTFVQPPFPLTVGMEITINPRY